MDFEFHEVIAKVEERFRPELDSEAAARLAGTSESHGKYEPTQISTGWWIVLSRFGVAVGVGPLKPDAAAGDTLVLVPKVIKKKPDAPHLAVVPPAPPPLDAETARKIWMESLPPETAARIGELMLTT